MPDSTPASEFASLMERVLAGTPGAADELLKRYQFHLLRAIRERLHWKLRRLFDSLDFVQDVWASFFLALPQCQDFRQPDNLIGYLVRVAQHKITDTVRCRLRGAKHRLDREEALDDSRQFDKDQLVDARPSPTDLAMSRDALQTFLERQPLLYQRIFELLREGQTSVQIARQLGINEKTVRRVGNKFLEALTQ